MPTQPLPKLAQDKRHHHRNARAEPPVPARMCRHQDTVFKHAVIVNCNGHKHNVTRPVRVKPVHKITQQSNLGRLQPPREAQPPFGIKSLCVAPVGRHLDIAREHFAVERPTRAAANEICTPQPDQRRQRPDPRPFPHRIAECGRLGRQIGHQHIIHVAAVVHYKHGRGVVRNSGEHYIVLRRGTDTVNGFRQNLGHPHRETEIGKGGKARHDLARVCLRFLKRDVLGHFIGMRISRNFCGNLGIIDQPLDHVIAPRQFERLDRPLQTGIEPRHCPLEPAAKKPPHRGH